MVKTNIKINKNIFRLLVVAFAVLMAVSSFINHFSAKAEVVLEPIANLSMVNESTENDAIVRTLSLYEGELPTQLIPEVTGAVQDQYSSSDCWAFGVTAMLEENLYKMGFRNSLSDDGMFNFSEAALYNKYRKLRCSKCDSTNVEENEDGDYVCLDCGGLAIGYVDRDFYSDSSHQIGDAPTYLLAYMVSNACLVDESDWPYFDEDGNYSFDAPDEYQTYDFMRQIKKGVQTEKQGNINVAAKPTTQTATNVAPAVETTTAPQAEAIAPTATETTAANVKPTAAVEENTTKPVHTEQNTSVEPQNTAQEAQTVNTEKETRTAENTAENADNVEKTSETAETSTVSETENTEAKKVKKPKAEKARENLVKLTAKTRFDGAMVKDGNQYISDGFFAVKFNNVSENIKKAPAELNDKVGVFDKILQDNAQTADHTTLVEVDADKIRALVPTKKAEYIYNQAKIGDFNYQIHYLSKMIDALGNPKLYVKRFEKTKGSFNPIYMVSESGEGVLLPVRADYGKETYSSETDKHIVYSADYVSDKKANSTPEKVTAETKNKVAAVKKKTKNKTETATAEVAATVSESTINGKSYKDFSVEEFKALPPAVKEYYIVKNKKPNAVVFYRLGDFYELLFDDAEKLSAKFDLTLSGKQVKGYSDRVKMAGIPFNKFEEYKSVLNADGLDVVTVENNNKKTIYKAKTETTVESTTEKQKVVKAVEKTEDFGEKIGGARKDEWHKRGLIETDIDVMNKREIEKHVKKENVWKRPNWAEAVNNGAKRGLLYAQNEVYKSLNTTPYYRSLYKATEAEIQETAKTYTKEISEIKSMIEKATTPEEIKAMGGEWLTKNGYTTYVDDYGGMKKLQWTEKYYNSPALYGSNYANMINYLAKSFDRLEVKAAAEWFGVETENRLPKGFTIIERTDWRGVGKGKFIIVKGRLIVSNEFNSFNEALAFGKEKFGTAAKASATDGKKGKQRYVPEQLKDVHREGLDYRNGSNASGDGFIKDFGIKGGEFGNWLSENDRVESLNYGYDALCDMADALDMELSDISLNGTLNIGFGSRGKGLSGAAAHYEPDRKVINLTKMNGAGSLAHEWWHAFEDYATGDTHQSEMTSSFSKMPENTKKAAIELVNKINYREATVEEKNLAKQKRYEQSTRRLTSALNDLFSLFGDDMTAAQKADRVRMYRYKRVPTEADIAKYKTLKDKLFTGDLTAIDELSALRKEVYNRVIPNEQGNGNNYGKNSLVWYASDLRQSSGENISVRKHTKYHDDAIAISKAYAKDGGYWDSNCEMLARAFAAYISDKTNRKNDYLSGHSESAVPVYNEKGELVAAYIMPVGEERQNINNAFDNLFTAAKKDGLIKQATRTKPATSVKYAVSESVSLNTQPAGNQSQNLKPLQMKRAEAVARMKIKGYSNLTEAQKLEVDWTLASSWKNGVSEEQSLQLAKISAELGTGIGFADIKASTKDGKSVSIDGICYTRGGHSTIYFSPKSVNTVEIVALEEITHALEGTEGYEELRKMAEEYYNTHVEEKQNIENAYRKLYENEQVKFAEEILPSELTAHYVREILGKRNMIATLTKEQAETTKGILGMLKKLKEKFIKADAATTYDMDILENRFKSVYNQYKKNVAEGKTTATARNTAGAFSLNESLKSLLPYDADEIKSIELNSRYKVARSYSDVQSFIKKAKTSTSNDLLFLGKISIKNGKKIIESTGLNVYGKSIVLSSNDIQHIFNGHSNESAEAKHGQIAVTESNFESVVETLIEPDSVERSDAHGNTGIVFKKNINGRITAVTFVSEKKKALTLKSAWIIKEKQVISSTDNAQALSFTSETRESMKPVSDTIIRNSVENVNSESDSDGNSLSYGQSEFFKDSKVRNAKGKIIPVYHNSKVEFNEFSQDKIASNGGSLFGKGFYFYIGDKESGSSYGNIQRAFYLDIQNPFEVGTHTVDELLTILDKANVTVYDEGLHNKLSDYKNKDFKEIVDEDEIDFIYQFTEEDPSTIFKRAGYDGIIAWDAGEAVAFNSNQAKLTTNSEPTEKSDIRYALSDTTTKTADSFKSIKEVDEYYENEIQNVYQEYKKVDPFGLQASEEQRTALRKYLDAYNKLSADKKTMAKAVKRNVISADSEGRLLSKEQISRFKGSKVVDADGRLKVCYHGTGAMFNEFSYDFLGKNGTSYGKGFYFSDSAEYSEGYTKDGGRLMKCYLSIKKPLSLTKKNISVDKLRKLLTALSRYETVDGINPLSDYADIDSYGVNAAINEAIKTEYEYNDNDVDLIHSVYNAISGIELDDYYKLLKKTLGYDGIIEKRENENFYVTFQSNQSKNIDNVSPTDSSDVRYAVSSAEDLVMTELPDERITFRDVITKRRTASEYGAQIKSNTAQYKEGAQVLLTNAQAGLERVLRETGNDDATAETNYVRAAKAAANNALDIDGGQYDLSGNIRVGDSLGKIYKPIYSLNKKDGNALKQFNLYLLHYHNIDRMAVGKPVFNEVTDIEQVTAADSQAAIIEIEKKYPIFKKIAPKVWNLSRNNMQLNVDSGVYSQEYADSLMEMYPHYVPTYRDEHIKSVAAIQGKGNLQVNANRAKAKGSGKKILPIDDMLAQQTLQKYQSARVNAMLVKMLNGSEHEEFKVISSEDVNIDVDSDSLVTTHEDKAKKTHQITFYNNGKKITAEVSYVVYKGIEALTPSTDSGLNNALLNGVAKANTMFKKLVTAWNPFFSFFRNPLRDIQEAGLYTKYPLKVFAKNYGRARQEITTNGKYWQEAKAAGITAASVYDYEKGLNLKRETLESRIDKTVIKKIENKIEFASNAIEMAPRMAEYISAREAGLSVKEALLQAQDITTNFGRGGTFAKTLNATVMPFLNPAIQGFSKMVRAYTGKDAAQSWLNLIVRSLLLGVGLTALNDLLNDDDEEYDNLSEYVKQDNYVLSLGNGNFIKIPKGRVASVFGGAFLRAKWLYKGDTDAFDGYIKSCLSAVTPADNISRNIFSPITDLATNTTWYGGTIEGQKWDDTEPKNRYDESTSSISIWLGKVFNYSPIKINYLLEQYGGIVSDIVLPATNLESESGIVNQNFITNSIVNNRWSSEFYEQKEKYTYKKTAGDNAAKGVVKYLNSINHTISEMYTQKREIQADKSLSDGEKLSQVKIVQATINALEKDTLTNAKYLYEEMQKYGDISNDDIFDAAYLDAINAVVGAEYALKSYNTKVYAKAKELNKIGISYGTYYDYYFTVKNILSVSDSKKENVINYTLSQKISPPQKLILIMSQGYVIKDGDINGLTEKKAKKIVADYINGLPISAIEKEEMAKMCNLTVKNGRIVTNM